MHPAFTVCQPRLQQRSVGDTDESWGYACGMADLRDLDFSPPKGRYFVANGMLRSWREYAKDAGGANEVWEYPEFADPLDRLFHYAVTLIQEVVWLDGMTPLEDITLGKVEEMRFDTLQRLREIANSAGFVTERSHRLPKRATESFEVFEEIREMLVRRARALGASWRAIGESMGMTGQGAYKKAIEKGWVVAEANAETKED